MEGLVMENIPYSIVEYSTILYGISFDQIGGIVRKISNILQNSPVIGCTNRDVFWLTGLPVQYQ